MIWAEGRGCNPLSYSGAPHYPCLIAPYSCFSLRILIDGFVAFFFFFSCFLLFPALSLISPQVLQFIFLVSSFYVNRILYLLSVEPSWSVFISMCHTTAWWNTLCLDSLSAGESLNRHPIILVDPPGVCSPEKNPSWNKVITWLLVFQGPTREGDWRSSQPLLVFGPASLPTPDWHPVWRLSGSRFELFQVAGIWTLLLGGHFCTEVVAYYLWSAQSSLHLPLISQVCGRLWSPIVSSLLCSSHLTGRWGHPF